MKVVKFISYSEVGDRKENSLGGMGGFFENGMRWKDYKDVWKESVHEDLENLRAAIIANQINCTGDEHQHSGYPSVPLFDDGSVALYSFRAWGDLMAAVWSSEYDKDYSYMSFYM